MEEIEIKFLDVDPKELEKKLKARGAKKVFSRLFKRKTFEFPGWPLNKQGAWLQIRDEGDKTMLRYKRRLGRGLGGAKGDTGAEEVQVEVSDLDKLAEIFYRLGMEDKFYQENKRTEYILDGVVVDIDTWPLLKPFVEFEGDSWDEVYQVAKSLGFNKEDAKIIPTWEMYKLKGMNEGDYLVLTFDKQVKRKN